jgi:DNA repair protein RadC
LQYGFDIFQDYEKLEMLLYYAIPRKDTTAIARKLIESFGSVKGVFDATCEDIMAAADITQNTAVLIKLISSFARAYAIDSVDEEKCYSTLDKIGKYLVARYVGIQVERIYMMMFNNRLELLGCEKIMDGTVNESSIIPRLLVEKAISKHASAVVLSHNHPNGIAIPSGMDIDMTHEIERVFNLMGIHLLEHIIVSGNNFTPIMRKQKGVFRASPISGEIDEDFFLTFYNEKK